MNLKRRFTSGMAALIAGIATVALFASPASAAKIQYGVISQDPPPDARDYELMNKAGVDLRRLPFGWDSYQFVRGDCTPEGGACDWSRADLAIGAAASHGIATLPYFYNSARFINSNPIKPPLRALDEWADWIQAAVQRYGRGGVYWQGDYQAVFGPSAPQMPVDTWQIWNEQTSDHFFLPKPDPKKYAKLLKPASEAIRSVDPRAEILLGGIFGETGPKGQKLETFFEKLYKIRKIERYFDAVAVHPYATKPKGVLNQAKKIRKAADKGGDKKADVWVTELGYASAGPRGGRAGELVMKGERGQAAALKKAFKILKKNARKLDLAGIVWYAWEDVDNPGLCKFCQRAGLIDLKGRPKSAYKEFRQAAD